MMRRSTIYAAVFVALVGGYAAYQFIFARPTNVPPEFNEARLQGAMISQAIVDTSNNLSRDIAQVNDLDAKGDYAGALRLTLELVNSSQEIRAKAVELSAELEKMTKALSSIDSTSARQAALESISSRLALISRLINYSDETLKLLQALENKFSGAKKGDAKVADAVNQINAEVAAINNFNREATEAMTRFDAIVK